MQTGTTTGRRRLFVPEVIQTSGMDCGPACLKTLLEGFGIKASYSRLREACRTDVDGTSIDVIEEVAVQLGLEASQYIVPADHLLMAEADALPAMVVTRLPTGLTHFVVLWRAHGRFVQVMDPAEGRLFRTSQRFLNDVYIHRFPVPQAFAKEWLTAPAFLGPLRRRLSDLGISPEDIDALLEETRARSGWLPIAALDAATRLAARLVRAGAIEIGSTAALFVRRLAAKAAQGGVEGAFSLLPQQYWSVRPGSGDEVELCGAVLVHVAGRAEPDAAEEAEVPASPELAAVLGESPRPLQSILAAAFAENPIALLALPLALLIGGATPVLQGLLLVGFIGVGQTTGARTDPSQALWIVIAFLLSTFLLNLAISAVCLRLGRWLELHLRVRLLDKLPRLGNYYFHSRLKSDLALRAFGLRSLCRLPALVANGLRSVSQLLVTMAGILWLWPAGAFPVALSATVLVGLPVVFLPFLKGQDLRCQTHAAALTRFYLDSLQGLMPLQAHRAEEPVRTEHESLLVKWAASTKQANWTQLGALGAGMLAGVGFSIWVASQAIVQVSEGPSMILVVSWALQVPMLSQSLAGFLQQLPGLQNQLLRLFDVLSGPEETELHGNRDTAPPHRQAAPDPAVKRTGVQILMRGVDVHAGGHRILSDVELELRPGEHVAVVGPSGSGKTSLVGLILGWHRAASGSIWVDGAPAQAEQIRRLRRETAWVDPAVQIWNRSFEQNLKYGNGDAAPEEVTSIARKADLAGVVERLPAGIESSLGEGGGLISAGEGQRVRLARAMLRAEVRLAILDEPFRGLDRDKRLELLAEARERWRDATLVYVSHDIDTALDFERILVLENGRVVEDGSPAALLERSDSRLTALKEAQEALHQEIWGSPVWRRWRMERGELRELDREDP